MQTENPLQNAYIGELLNQLTLHTTVFASKSIVNVDVYVKPVAFHTTFQRLVVQL